MILKVITLIVYVILLLLMEPLSIKQYWYFLIHICGYYIAKGYIIFFTGNQQHKLSFLPTSHQQQLSVLQATNKTYCFLQATNNKLSFHRNMAFLKHDYLLTFCRTSCLFNASTHHREKY
jgi:hypothetical protein